MSDDGYPLSYDFGDDDLESVYVTPAATIPDIATSSGFNIDDALKLIQGGVNAYGQVKKIDSGGYESYSVPGQNLAPAPGGNLPAPTPQGAAQSSFMQKLTDFSTPVPYAVGLVGLFGVLMLVKVARR